MGRCLGIGDGSVEFIVVLVVKAVFVSMLTRLVGALLPASVRIVPVYVKIGFGINCVDFALAGRDDG